MSTSIKTRLATCATFHQTRQTTGYRLDKGGTNVGPDIDPFHDFDTCEMFEGRNLALIHVENSPGPENAEEAEWPENRINSLLFFSGKDGAMRCESEFAERLMAWYISSSRTTPVAVQAIQFVLGILDHPEYFGYGRRTSDNELITLAVGKAVREHPDCYSKAVGLSDFLKQSLLDLLKEWHTETEWNMAADILETICAGGDCACVPNIKSLLVLYATGKTGRHSGRHHDRRDEQKLWTTAEVAYMEQALVILEKLPEVCVA